MPALAATHSLRSIMLGDSGSFARIAHPIDTPRYGRQVVWLRQAKEAQLHWALDLGTCCLLRKQLVPANKKSQTMQRLSVGIPLQLQVVQKR